MKNNLLSIGEVARMKGVSVKSLRYYERIGILLPAQVDERTGYRSYTLSQMPEVDIIQSCIESDIPLKQLAGYRTERGTLDIAALLEYGRSLALEKLRRTRGTLAQIDSYSKGMNAQQTYRRVATGCVRDVEECTVLVKEWGRPSFDAKRYVSAMTELYQRAAKEALTPLYLQGMACFAASVDGSSRWYVVLEVCDMAGMEGMRAARDEGVTVMMVPGGTYRVLRIEGEGFEQCFEQVFEEFDGQFSSDKPLLALDVWSPEVESGRSVVELLCG